MKIEQIAQTASCITGGGYYYLRLVNLTKPEGKKKLR